MHDWVGNITFWPYFWIMYNRQKYIVQTIRVYVLTTITQRKTQLTLSFGNRIILFPALHHLYQQCRATPTHNIYMWAAKLSSHIHAYLNQPIPQTSATLVYAVSRVRLYIYLEYSWRQSFKCICWSYTIYAPSLHDMDPLCVNIYPLSSGVPLLRVYTHTRIYVLCCMSKHTKGVYIDKIVNVNVCFFERQHYPNVIHMRTSSQGLFYVNTYVFGKISIFTIAQMSLRCLRKGRMTWTDFQIVTV